MPETGVAPVADAPADPVAEVPVPVNSETEIDPGAAPDAALAGPETEVFYTFTWRGNRPERQPRREGGAAKGRRDGGKPQGDRPRGKGKPKGKGQPPRDAGAKTFQARPPKKEKQIDPDNPFAAALMGLKTKD
jgi:ATP-dependent RNA helicase SUPV3L1/SUV3